MRAVVGSWEVKLGPLLGLSSVYMIPKYSPDPLNPLCPRIRKSVSRIFILGFIALFAFLMGPYSGTRGFQASPLVIPSLDDAISNV